MLLNFASIRQIQLWRMDLVASTVKAGHGDRNPPAGSQLSWRTREMHRCRTRLLARLFRKQLVVNVRHGLSVGFERAESGIRKIRKPAILGNISAASGDTRVKTAAGTSPLINRSTAFV
jgi:hypothetical protein